MEIEAAASNRAFTVFLTLRVEIGFCVDQGWKHRISFGVIFVHMWLPSCEKPTLMFI